jgi:integrase/recombinase XerD
MESMDTMEMRKVDLEMKAKALANCEVGEEEPHQPWRENKGLMQFLKSL